MPISIPRFCELSVTWAPANSDTRVVDLTHPLVGQAPAYPGAPAGTFAAVTTVARDGCLISEIRSRSHVGTHADAPAHFLADGETTFDISVDRWMGHAWIARVTPGPSGRIESEMLTLPAEPAHVLLIATGHSRSWGTERYYRQAPYLSEAAAERVKQAGFGVLGLDFPSPDEVGSATEPCHHVLLGAGVLIIENLTGLEGIGADQCWFCAAPLLVGGGDGGFCRAFAAVDTGRSQP
jgi:arylformamidase